MNKDKHWYDGACKRILSNKYVLLNILKREVKEYKDLSDEEILSLICEPQLGVNDSDMIETRNVEDLFMPDEKIIYDVILYAKLPDSDEKIGLIINLEVQKDKTEYSILKRGFYYLSRLIARQKGHPHGFHKSEYQNLKKVIGIWICRMDKGNQGLLNVYSTKEEQFGIQKSYPKNEYDLMQLILISPFESAIGETGTVHFLSLLFGNQTNGLEATERLEKEYGVVLNKNEREELSEMCNWSMAHYLNGKEAGIAEGRIEGRNEGRIEGRNEGRIEGIVIGEKSKATQIAEKMLKSGIELKIISQLTEMSEDEVMSIRNQVSLLVS